jgi:phosphoglycerate kinase
MTPAFRTLDSVDLSGKRVLVRVDLNVPTDNGKVTDFTRIERVVPTIKEIADKGGKVILLAHFGRPKGRDPKESLKPGAEAVARVVGRPVAFADDCVGEAAQKAISAMKDGDILCLENTRFHKEEEKNDPAFVEKLARLGDVYVNDAFSAAHRAHATTEGLARKLPAYAGRTMQAELEALGRALETPTKPVIAVVGCAKVYTRLELLEYVIAKVSTKLDLLENLISKVQALVIGGAMANTFMHAQGVNVQKSLAEKDMADTARRILAKAEDANCAIILPVDATIAYHFEANAPAFNYGLDAIPADAMILDVGPQSIERIKGALDDAATLVWNGPLGAFEMKPFDAGTVTIARYAAERTKQKRLVSVAGGGDTVAALNAAGVAEKFTYVSTAGGAFLEWLEGRKLPGVEALRG